MADIRGILVSRNNANTPAISTTNVVATALSENTNRAAWAIQNQGTAVVFVKLGSGASSSSFHFTLAPVTTNDDGSGGIISQAEGVVYTGIITVAPSGSNIIRYTVMEL